MALAALIWLIVLTVTGKVGGSDDDGCFDCCWKEEPLWEEDFKCDQCFDDPQRDGRCDRDDWHNMECKRGRGDYRKSHCRYYEWGHSAPECEDWRRDRHRKRAPPHGRDQCDEPRHKYGRGDHEHGHGQDRDRLCRFKLFDLGIGLANDTLGGITQTRGVMCVDSTPFGFTIPAANSGMDGPHPLGGLDHVKFLTYIRNEDGDPTLFEAFKSYDSDDDDHGHGHRRRHDKHRKPHKKDDDEDDEEGECEPELLYEAKVKCEVSGATRHPYPNALVPTPDEDPRLAACAINSIAFQEFNDGIGKGAWLVADFFMTNNLLFALYERLPFGKPSFGGDLNEYHAGTHFIPVAYRTPDEWHKLGIAFNHQLGIIRWLINDVEVYRVTRVGFPLPLCDRALDHGGQPEEVFPQHLSFGFGTFTLLDAHHYNNGSCTPNPGLARLTSGDTVYRDPFSLDPAGQPQFPDTFYYNNTVPLGARLWRQGAKMCIDWMKVRKQKCTCV